METKQVWAAAGVLAVIGLIFVLIRTNTVTPEACDFVKPATEFSGDNLIEGAGRLIAEVIHGKCDAAADDLQRRRSGPVLTFPPLPGN